MTERDMAERVGELMRLADRLRTPDHRFTAEMFMIAREDLCLAIRRLDRDLGRRATPPAPAALARDRDRQQQAQRPRP